ncbi:MAG: succinate dehydrogenase cytochrome b558 subunit [Phycisphaerae bacterium]
MTEGVNPWLEKNHFLLRRLHSLSGIAPVGAFLMVHLFTNSLAAWSPESFDQHVKDIHHIPYLPIVEWLGIFLPLAFHAGYGVVIARTGKSNVQFYTYADNWRYTMQRVSGWIALVFMVVHLLHFRFAHWLGGVEYQPAIAAGETPFNVTAAGFETLLPQAIWFVFYAVGLLASIFHLCNGVTTFCITWGITVSDASRKRVSIGATGLAAVLTIWGFSSLIALTAAPAKDLKAEKSKAAEVVADASRNAG